MTAPQWFSIIAVGILSPDFYCLYIENLIAILKTKDVVCYVLSVFLAALI